MTGVLVALSGHYGETTLSISNRKKVLQRGVRHSSLCWLGVSVMPGRQPIRWNEQTRGRAVRSAKFVAKIVLFFFCLILSSAVFPCNSKTAKIDWLKIQATKEALWSATTPFSKIFDQRDVNFPPQSCTSPPVSVWYPHALSRSRLDQFCLISSHILSQSAVLLRFKRQIQSMRKQIKNNKQTNLEARTVEGRA